MDAVILVNYIAWFVFVFIAIVWILVMFENRGNYSVSRKAARLPSVTVIVPAYNEEGTIEKTLNSLLSLDYPRRLLEIIVMDDASTDRTPELAGKYSGRVKIIRNRKNMGKAYSLNRAIGMAKGELVACMDADSVVRKDIIMKMVGYFSERDVAAVTPALGVYKPRNFLEKIQHVEYLLNMFLRKTLAFMDSIHVTPGVFTLYRKDIITSVGGFDECNLTEDMEIALKLHKAGYRIENNMNAKSFTCCPDKWGELFRQRIRWYRGAIQNTVKYRGMLFNPKYGNLGMFLLPFNFIAVMSIIFIFTFLAWNYSTMLVGAIWKLHLVNFDVAAIASGVNWQFALVNAFSSPLLLSLIGILLGGYVLYASFRVNNLGIRSHKPQYFAYLLLFPFALMAFWFLAILSEVFRVRRKW